MSFILNALKKAESDKRQRQLPGLESYQQPMKSAWWNNVDPLKWLTILIITINIIGLIVYGLVKPQGTTKAIENTAEFDIVNFQSNRYIQSLPGFDQYENSPNFVNSSVQNTSSIGSQGDFQNKNSGSNTQPTKMKPGEVIVADLQNESSNQAENSNPTQTSSIELQSDNWESLDEYSDLPLAWQKELPDMSFAAHVYMENPAASFIIVNGQNLSSGDSLGEINLIAVHEKGAIFQMRGKKFKVKF
jgi:general secretion pathway protein B